MSAHDGSREQLDAQALSFGPLFSNSESAVPLSYAEVADILGIVRNELESNDKLVPEDLKQTLMYCQRMGVSMDVSRVREMRRLLEEMVPTNTEPGRKLHPFEIVQLVNLGSFEDSANAIELIPSLVMSRSPGPVNEALLAEAVEEVNKLSDY